MNTRHQGGWVVSFFVIGAVLLVTLLGGVYYLRNNRGQTPEQEPQVGVIDDQSTSSGSDEQTPAEETDVPSDNTDAKQSQPTLPGENKTTALPETGASDGVYGVLAASVSTFSLVAYLRSRS